MERWLARPGGWILEDDLDVGTGDASFLPASRSSVCPYVGDGSPDIDSATSASALPVLERSVSILSSDRAAAVRRRDQQFPGQGTKYFDEGVPNELYIRHKTKLMKVPAVRNLGGYFFDRSPWVEAVCHGWVCSATERRGGVAVVINRLASGSPSVLLRLRWRENRLEVVSRPDIRLQM